MELPERKIVLLGNTGHGKSSTGNTILGENVFITGVSPNSVTDRAVKKSRMVNRRKITVIDTPGFDAHCEKKTKSEILKALIECAPGVDAFIMVLKVGRYTRHDNEVLQKFLNTFSKEEVLTHTVILFTCGKRLQGQTIEEFVKKSSQLQELVDQCGGRCHVIDNKYWNNNESGNKSNRVQVKKLLDTIDEMVEENGLYTNELLKMVEEEAQEETEKMRRKHLTSEEKREKAKKKVHNRWLQAVGAFTGFLFGALLGAAVAVAFILILLTKLKDPLQLLGLGAGAAAAATTAGVVVVVSAIVGGLAGAVTGWKAAEEADSVYDAMIMATKLNYENVKTVVEKVTELVFFPFRNK